MKINSIKHVKHVYIKYEFIKINSMKINMNI